VDGGGLDVLLAGLGRREFLGHPPLTTDQDAIAELQDVRKIGRDRRRVDAARRLVEDDEARLPNEPLADHRDALPTAEPQK